MLKQFFKTVLNFPNRELGNPRRKAKISEMHKITKARLTVLKRLYSILGIGLMVSLFFSIVLPTHGFIAYQHKGIFDKNVLIRKVHDAQWQIGYRFASSCPAEFREEEDRLKQLIVDVLRLWLQPLREISAKPIVDDFHLLLQNDFKENERENAKDTQALLALDARITFLCKRGFSYVNTGARPPDVYMRGEVVREPLIYVTVHELGHAFGMADTYVHPDKPENKSSGGLAGTLGTQPSSIMAVKGERRDHPYIKEDDKRGIIWLYKYIYEGQTLKDCFFPDYVFEADPAGCRPKYPLLYELKYGDRDTARRILEDDPTLDVNGRDAVGRTALHYAVMYEYWPVVRKLLARPDLSPYLRDKEGKTAADIAREMRRGDISILIHNHPRALSVSPKGKKIAVTWGELKRGD